MSGLYSAGTGELIPNSGAASRFSPRAIECPESAKPERRNNGGPLSYVRSSTR